MGDQQIDYGTLQRKKIRQMTVGVDQLRESHSIGPLGQFFDNFLESLRAQRQISWKTKVSAGMTERQCRKHGNTGLLRNSPCNAFGAHIIEIQREMRPVLLRRTNGKDRSSHSAIDQRLHTEGIQFTEENRLSHFRLQTWLSNKLYEIVFPGRSHWRELFHQPAPIRSITGLAPKMK